MAQKRTKTRPKNTGPNSGSQKSVALVPQPHGGALKVGNPGNRGGPGTVPSVLRERLRGSFDERIPVLEEIADGLPVQRLRVPVAEVLDHMEACGCGEGVVLSKDSRDVEIEVTASATPRDRIHATKALAEYGLGTTTTIEVVSPEVKARLQAQLDVIDSRQTWDKDELLEQLEAVWTT